MHQFVVIQLTINIIKKGAGIYFNQYELANTSYDENAVINAHKEGNYKEFEQQIMLDCGHKTCGGSGISYSIHLNILGLKILILVEIALFCQ